MAIAYLGGREGFEDARWLIETYGDEASYEAAARAAHSRDLGNHIHFCHWRQIERLIVLLGVEQPIGALH